MRVLIVEELSRVLLERSEKLVTGPDACWAARAWEWLAAREALDGGHWQTGDYPLFDDADLRLGRWAHDVAAAELSGRPLSAGEHAIFTYGLQVRLRSAARARAMVDGLVGSGSGIERIDLVASDPYLRALALSVAARRIKLRTHSLPGRSAIVASVREEAAASRVVRSVELALPHRRQDVGRRSARAIALFRPERGYTDHFEPIARELRSRGRNVVVFEYSRQIGENDGAIAFTRAVSAAGGRASLLPQRHWSIDAGATGAPVHAAAVKRAIQASWTTGAVQIERHQRVLERWRPNVVVSFGPETMSLALHAAARRCGIPSVFLPHGYLTPFPLMWSIPATALAVVGSACVQANAVTPVGVRQEPLVVIGHPQYDEFAQGWRGRPADRSRLGAPSSRPRLVLLFTEWGVDLLDQAMQSRTLRMAAEALPADAYLICKLHPAREERERSETLLGAILPSDAFTVVSSRDHSTGELLQACDVAVATEESMALIDAVVMRRPGIGIRHPENPPGTGPLRHPARRIDEICTVVSTVDQLRDALERTIVDPAAHLSPAEERMKYVRRSLFAIDGRSSFRAADLIEHLEQGQDPSLFAHWQPGPEERT